MRPEVEAAIRRAQAAYQEGNVSIFVVLETTRQLLDSRLREAVLEADLRRFWAELERSVGRRLPAGPAPPPATLPGLKPPAEPKADPPADPKADPKAEPKADPAEPLPPPRKADPVQQAGRVTADRPAAWDRPVVWTAARNRP